MKGNDCRLEFVLRAAHKSTRSVFEIFAWLYLALACQQAVVVQFQILKSLLSADIGRKHFLLILDENILKSLASADIERKHFPLLLDVNILDIVRKHFKESPFRWYWT